VKALDLSTTRRTLRQMLENGLITLENLDEPSPGFRDNMNVSPLTFPNGYRGVRFQNLLRDEILEEF
jgi:hypothetical protein